MGVIIKLKDLQPHTGGIYKLNYPNGKIYIGLSNDIKRRMYEHNNSNRLNNHYNQPCDLAIAKYGRFEEVEILEFIDDKELLNSRERYWIKYYNSTNKNIGYNLTSGGNQLFGNEHPIAVFSEAQVLDIRKRRFKGERKKNVYQDYSNINFSTFEGVWLGKKYPNIGKEFIIPSNEISRQIYSSLANQGENNGRAKLTENKVRDIRKKYDNGMSISEISKIYSEVNQNSIRRICKRETWKNVI